ncbi:hypothetical protein JCM11491_003360 [Sporobolomyces phaffii]
MPPKRTYSNITSDGGGEEEEGDDEEDSDGDGSDYTSSHATSARSSRSGSSNKKPRSPPPVPGDVLKRHAAAGLLPRGRLFGGPGLIRDDQLRGGREKPAPPGEPKVSIKRNKSTGNGMLTFKRTKEPKAQQLEYLRPEVLTTTKPDRGRGKAKKQDAEEGDDSDEEEENPNVVNVHKVVGEPERVQLAMVGGPSHQVPWILDRFGSFPKQSRSSGKKKKGEVEDEGDSDEEDTGKRKKNKKLAKSSKPSRTFKDSDNTTLLIYHDTPFDDSSKVRKFKTVVTHQANEKGKFNANFFWIVYTEPITQRLHLRIAITSANPTSESYSASENTIWMQDFPELVQVDKKDEETEHANGSKRDDRKARKDKKDKHNPTHTSFSTAFLGFLGGGLELPTQSDYKGFLKTEAHFDFSKSKDVRAVVSIAGKYSGATLEFVGGFDSLAKAVSSFKPDISGVWRIEYITATSLPINEKFLRDLFAACLGISPTELAQQSTAASEVARTTFSRKKIKLGYPTVDTVEEAVGYNVGRYALKFETDDDVDFDRLGANDARRQYADEDGEDRTIMHDFKLKSGRVNHSNVLLIIHTPKSESSTDFEAFVYLGSHSPTLESWGKYKKKSDGTVHVTIAQSELGVVVRIRADSWRELVKEMNEFVPYERKSLHPYEASDVPFPTPEPRVVKPKGRKKKQQGDDSD